MADGGNGHQFGQIQLGIRGGVSQGQLKIGPGGFNWRRVGGGKTVEIKKEDIADLLWTKVSRGCQLGVRRAEGSTVNFLGFREKDFDELQKFADGAFGKDIKVQTMSTSGHNWGSLAVHGSSLMFLVEDKPAFEVPLPDVSQAQQAKDEVMLEFHVDDTVADDKEDTLVEIAFHVPPTNEQFAPAEDANGAADGNGAAAGPHNNAAKVLLDSIMQHTDAGVATSDDAVCIFDDVAVLAPRGRFEVEMHLGFLKLVGQTQDFKIRYGSIVRLFVLPKSATPQSLVVISLDPPIRKGQTYYTHLLCQFGSEETTTVELDISDEQLALKNEKCGGKLSKSVSGTMSDVFAKVLRGLSGAKLTRPGTFRSAAGDAAVRCSYKADDGYLYPLERAFFYIQKPPLLMAHDDIESVEFQRQGGGVLASSVRTFDLVIRMKGDSEYQFRNIQRSEWQHLFEFIHSKKIRVENLAAAKAGPMGGGAAIDLGDELDAGMRAAVAEAGDDEEEDEDFAAGSEDGSASGSSDLSEGGSGTDSSDAEMIDEEGISMAAISGKKKGSSKGSEGGAVKRKAQGDAGASGSGASPKPKPAKKGKADKSEEGGKPAKKPRKKKDKNAPKGALSAFMYFSNANREKVKADNPGIAFGEIGKIIGAQWKELTPEDKAPYEEKAARDKERYAAEMQQYTAAGGGGGGDAGGSRADAGSDDAGGESE